MQFETQSGKLCKYDGHVWTLSTASPTGELLNVLTVPGTVGAVPVCAYVSEDGRVFFEEKRRVRTFSELYFVCLQRYNKQIKTCDIVWLDHGVPVVQTIARADVDAIRERLTCDVYMWPMDPLPWKRFSKDAEKYDWQKTDWVHLMAMSSSEESLQDDSDWTPSNEESSEEDDE